MKYTLTIESDDANDIRSVADKLATRDDAPVAKPTPKPKADDKPKDEIDENTEKSVDSIGMPYDETIHADPPSFKADGSWKVRNGQASAAKAAIAAFKAGGGNIEPPVVEDAPVETGGMPGVKAQTGMPVPTAEPVTLDVVMKKWTGLMESGKLSAERATEICVEVTGKTDAQQHYPTFQTDETARADLYAKLNEIEAG